MSFISSIPNKRLRQITRTNLKYARKPRRYRHLLDEAAKRAPSKIIEIGVFRGMRGVEIIEAASLRRPAHEIQYHGFDLFDQMDDDILENELSKVPDPIDTIRARLTATGANIELHPGWTHETLPAYLAKNPQRDVELAFIDGGHAVETIRTDWEAVSKSLSDTGVAIFDDYYVDCPHLIEEFGCNQIIEALDPKDWAVTILPVVDRFVNDGVPLNVSFVHVERQKS